jgi:hypothetical protein
VSGSTNVRSAVTREVTVWLSLTGGTFPETTVADLEAFLERLRANGGHDATRVRYSTELIARLTATMPLPAPDPIGGDAGTPA